MCKNGVIDVIMLYVQIAKFEQISFSVIVWNEILVHLISQGSFAFIDLIFIT
jgi:hypothetical protein